MTRVIAGPAGHWYTLSEGELIGLPMSADEDLTTPPEHPEVSGDWVPWVQITDPAPETDVAALTAVLTARKD